MWMACTPLTMCCWISSIWTSCCRWGASSASTTAAGALSGAFPGAELRVIPFPRLWTHLRLSFELLTRPRPDVLFVPAHVLPLAHPLPSVVTVHDLGYRHFPGAHPASQRLYLDWSTRYSAR